MPTTSQQFKHKHQQEHQHPKGSHPKPKRKAAAILAIIGAVAGALIGYISNNDNLVWVLIGVVLGGIAGYVFGHNIDKTVQ